MATLFVEGFDKYGPPSVGANTLANLIVMGDWNTSTGGNPSIAAGLSTPGYSLQYTAGPATLARTLATNYARLIGGIRFRVDLANVQSVMQFRDVSTAQCTLCVEQTSGVINFRNGTTGGAIIASGPAIVANSIHYLEWDITFGNAAAYQVWLDGISIMSGTGDTTATANNFANAIALGASATGQITYDDLYLFDNSGTTNNAVLLTNPRIETTFPISDNAAQFAFGAAILGERYSRSNQGSTQPGANTLFLRPFTPAVNCTLSSIVLLPFTTNGAVQYRGVVYADSTGVAGALLSSGPTQVGSTNGTTKTLPLTTPQNLTAGTQYWLGFMIDIAGINTALLDASNAGYRATVTFSSGAPGTAPAMTTTQPTFHLYGILTAVSTANSNWYEVSQQPAPGSLSYVFDATVGHEDLYNYPALSAPPAAIYVVAVKAYAAKSDAGVRTVSMRMKSGATDSGGSATGQGLGTSFQWLTSVFNADPANGLPWTLAGLNSAQSGFRIDS
jgi:hypothetical protein